MTTAIRWATDIALTVGLVAAVAVVAAVEPKPAAPVPPADVPVVVAAGSAVDIPPLPPLALSFEDSLASKELPPLPPPPPPPPPPPAPPPPAKPPEDKIDPTRVINIGLTGERRFGLVRVGKTEADDKRLMFNQYGETNHTAVSVDDTVLPFFSPTFGRVITDLKSVGNVEANTSDKKFGDTTTTIGQFDGSSTLVVWECRGVRFEQRTEYVPGLVSRKIDTLRVRYTLTNVDSKPHKAGLRVMLDTFIGTNDGVPFFIPGRGQVIDKPVELNGKDVPDYILALERNDLSDPSMTVVQIGLAPPADTIAERPAGIALTRWPGNINATDPCGHLNHRWAYPRGASFDKDSAVVLAYLPERIAPGGQRVFEFTYGLGSLSGRNAELSLAPHGPFSPGKPFRVSAFVKNPKDGQVVKLEVPEGLTLARDETPEKAVRVQAGVSVTTVDWLVTPGAEFGGKATLTATLTGVAKAETATVFVHNPKPALQGLVVTGTPSAGGLVRVTAAVHNATADSSVAVTLPKGATLDTGVEARQLLKAGPVAQATWLVRLPPDAIGDLTVSAALSNSPTPATAVIRVPPVVPKLVDLRADGLLQAGGVIRVTAQVANPVAAGTVELTLPNGLTLAPGEKAARPTPAGRVAQVSWLVRVAGDKIGKVTLRAALGATDSKETTVELAAAKPVLTARTATDAAVVPGKPFWVVARVFHPPSGAKATLTLPAGLSIAGDTRAEITMTAKTADGVAYAEAAWPVTLDAYSGPTADMKVTVNGVGDAAVRVKCERGSVIR